ncbi:Dehydrogenase/reductase SDR family member 4 [Holothuria leucospilota]|uniref:Dehydrogenase/reductase SDR family member 4 n=1 Tax=Holothuria leucospilota TaxID=206669 RepID=A0A9Q1C2A9_HOLLE|nr:Dehydrogenase/reductase SDR family member 4 [Holothuria leucospilota]
MSSIPMLRQSRSLFLRGTSRVTDLHKRMMALCAYDDEYLKARFAGKVAICTASTSGIGYAAAERIAREGAKVVICSRRQEKVDAAVKKLRDQNLEVSGIVCHQAKKEDRQRLIDFTLRTYGGIDLLFASAGVSPFSGYMLLVTEKQWDKLFEVNVKSTFLIIRECVPHMAERGGGAIVSHSTTAGVFPEATRNLNMPYAVSKSAVIGLTKVLVEPLAQRNIRINCMAPGPIETSFLRRYIQQFVPGETGLPKQAYDENFMLRFGEPEECGSVVAFLLSEDASYMAGEIIPVCGGINLREMSKLL